MADPLPHPDDLADWLVGSATESDDGPAILRTFSESLAQDGLPLWRVSVATPTIDPHVRDVSLIWRRGQGSAISGTGHGEEGDAIFRRSPIYELVTNELRQARWRIEGGEGCNHFPLLADLRAAGGTDYVLRIVPFAPGTALMGAALSLTTDRAGGFSDDEIARLDRFVPLMGLTAYRLNLSHTIADVLAAYLGPMTSKRVLDGAMRRGQGEVMTAAILLADLRAFTTLTDGGDPTTVVGWLDDHLDVLGGAVVAHGGEVLKFTGDGFIAVFPAEPREVPPCPVCEQALASARAALAANAALNQARKAAGGPMLEVDLALHFGEVVYGNVGMRDRLDFTVIGRAVNEASRIETLCDRLDRHLLLSDSFARRCATPLQDLGLFALKGVGGERRIWGLAPA